MVNRLKETWRVGQSIWVRYRNTWYPGAITYIGSKRIEVLFQKNQRRRRNALYWDGYSTRLPKDLRPRDRQLKGKDKPQEED